MVVLGLVVIGLSSVDWVSAHGGGFKLTRRELAGPYELLLGTIPDPPVVGGAVLILQVANPDTGVRISGANVTLTPEAPGNSGNPFGTLTFGPDSFDPTLYEARANLDIAGAWAFIISVSGPDGSGTAHFTYDVKRTSPVAGIITLATLLALATVLGLSMRAFLKQRGNNQRPTRRRA